MTQTVTVRMDEDTYEALKSFAAATQTSINDTAIRAVHEFLKQPARQKEFDKLIDQARKQYRGLLDRLAKT